MCYTNKQPSKSVIITWNLSLVDTLSDGSSIVCRMIFLVDLEFAPLNGLDYSTLVVIKWTPNGKNEWTRLFCTSLMNPTLGFFPMKQGFCTKKWQLRLLCSSLMLPKNEWRRLFCSFLTLNKNPTFCSTLDFEQKLGVFWPFSSIFCPQQAYLPPHSSWAKSLAEAKTSAKWAKNPPAPPNSLVTRRYIEKYQ